MKFAQDTFIIMDVPAPISNQVKGVQQRFRDDALSSVPVHITLTGSGGVGVFDREQEEETVFAVLDAIASETSPVSGSFDNVLRFPGTDIFVLTLKDPRPLVSLHERIVKSGLRFMPSRFPFMPHCTICGRSPVSEGDAAQLLSLRIPGDFALNSISVYQVEEIPGKHLRRFTLRSIER